MSLRSQFLSFDTALAKHGVPPLTYWWRDGIGRWLDAYEAGHVLELWACVGRGAAKSTALYKLCAFFALFVDFAVPLGERHFAIVLSRLKEEASKGIQIIDRWLTLLGVRHRLAGDVIELVDLPRGIRVVAASVAATSGWRAFFVGRDERSKWSTEGAQELDADEVDTSAAAMTATHAFAPVVTTGSAWGAFGSFFEVITAGPNERRIVLGPAPTWIAAPHITEEDCRRKENDPRRFAREYACQFQVGALGAFDSDAVERAFTTTRPSTRIISPTLVIDASSGKSDTWAWGIVGWVDGILLFDLVDGIAGGFWEQVSGEQIVERLADGLARPRGIRAVHGDQRESLMLRSAFSRKGLAFYEHPWTATSKPAAVERVRRWFAEGRIALPEHRELRAELLAFEERITASGSFTFGARGSGHDDFVALLITAAMVDMAGQLAHSPGAIGVPSYRKEAAGFKGPAPRFGNALGGSMGGTTPFFTTAEQRNNHRPPRGGF